MSTTYTPTPPLQAAWQSAPPPVTSPFWHIVKDFGLVLRLCRFLPDIVLPIIPRASGHHDELKFCYPNLRDSILHLVLLVTQAGFILSLPFCVLFAIILTPAFLLLYFLMFAISHRLLCRLLNGPQHSRFQTGIPPERNAGNEAVQLSAEQWFFINGIATGQNWLQSNLDRLALTFRREMIGIRNPTKGILFDLIECLVQRDLNYRTGDIRAGCVVIKEALESPRLQKVVLILHSQGGIEGSAIIDWLCADVSDSALAKLEVYTFGNAARHFNNPIRYFAHPQNRIPHVANRPQPLNLIESRPSERVIRHIEHYANEDDFVAKIGVLKFSPSVAKKSMKVNPFHGAVYTRKATGHLLNQHYLDFMFEMKDGIVQESNPFMDSLVDSNGAVSEEALCNGDAAIGSNVCTTRQVVAMKSLSRLWGYRNGRTPAMSASEAHGESRGTW